MSITAEEARAKALMLVKSFERDSGGPFVLHETAVRRRTGWLFFYNTETYIRTGDVRYALAGNGPIFVTDAGEIEALPTAIHWEKALRGR